MHRFRFLRASLPLLACLFLAASPASAQAPCAADISGNGVVDALDLGQVLNAWGACQGCSADIDGNGIVAGEDMAAVLNSWGFECPKVTGVLPVAGPPFGGNTITITGTHLGGVTEVRIGRQLAHKVAIVDDNTVTAVVPASTPAGATGARLLTVTTDGGESILENGYTYVDLGAPAPPSITGIWPQYVSAAGGDTITVTGANFTGTAQVTVAGINCAFSVVSDSSVTVTSPAHAKGGMFSLAITTPGGTRSLPEIAFYQTPSWATLVEAFPDPSIVTSAALRGDILQSGNPWWVQDQYSGNHGTTQFDLMLIPSGIFTMGCTSGQPGCSSNAQPAHQVALTKAFYIGRTEVTQAQYKAVTGNSPSVHSQGSAAVPAEQLPLCPVENVNFNDCGDFCNRTGLRMPTEAEWEFACRAGTTTAYHGWPAQPGGTDDSSLLGNIAWCCGNSPTRPVAQKAPNGFGLYDMLGNVVEWTNDGYDADYYQTSPYFDPPGGRVGWLTNTNHSIRSFYASGEATVTIRGDTTACAECSDSTRGFRIARTP